MSGGKKRGDDDDVASVSEPSYWDVPAEVPIFERIDFTKDFEQGLVRSQSKDQQRRRVLASWRPEIEGVVGRDQDGDEIGLAQMVKVMARGVRREIFSVIRYVYAKSMKRLSRLEDMQNISEKRIGAINEQINRSLLLFDQALWLNSLDAMSPKGPSVRTIEVQAYLAGEVSRETANRFSTALGELVEALGFTTTSAYPDVFASFLRRFFARTKEIASQDEVAIRLKKLERVIELQALDKPQSEVDSATSQAFRNVVEAVKDVDEVAVKLGSLLVVKRVIGGKTQVAARNLGSDELIFLARHPELMNSPSTILEEIGHGLAKDEAVPVIDGSRHWIKGAPDLPILDAKPPRTPPQLPPSNGRNEGADHL